jgi:hypothetical protein
MKYLASVFIFSALLFSLLPNTCLAQKKKPKNLEQYDKRIIHFGFSLAVNSGNFAVVQNPNFHSNDTLLSILPTSSAGFNLGIVTNLHMGDHFDLRFIPALSFVTRNLTYTFSTTVPNATTAPSNTVLKTVASTFVEFPLMLKFKSRRINNYRMYVFAGLKYAIDMASKKADKDKDRQPLKIQTEDYGYEIGFGMDFYLDYIKFSPEIKMFNGLKNVLVKDDLVYASSLDKLRSKIFTFSITFE